MRNPLVKRIPRELKHDFAKYIVIFLFLIMLISMVSSFLVVDESLRTSYDEGLTKYNIEDGHVAFNRELTTELRDTLEEKGELTIYELAYFEETYENANIRVYKDRQDVNLECLMAGEMPEADNEIALDRMYAQNNEIAIGDTITLNGKELVVSGLIALADYSCLFEENSSMMFDAINFSVAVMTEEGYEAVDSSNVTYNYAWKYNKAYGDDIEAKDWSENLMDVLSDEIEAYDTALAMEGKLEELVTVENYLPRYLNKAINFTAEDMGKDKSMIIIFDYLITIVLAFVFAVTISNTIAEEAGVIGTLRASGYTRGELLRHYMVLPVLVTFVAAVIGNAIGYTFMKQYMVQMYYNSYSLATYETVWSAEAFVYTTIIPVILMFVVNLIMLSQKLKLSPLRFLRRDLSKRGKKKAFRLNTKIPIMHRFRLRILFQNIPNYITLMFGTWCGAILVIFGLMFVPLFEDYAKLIVDSKIANYQYVLTKEVETEIAGAEKYIVTELETTNEKYMLDDVMIYGVVEDSKYITSDIPEGQVLVSNGFATKFQLEEGDVVTLKESYSDKTYDFIVGGVYTYDAAIAIFMDMEDCITTFDLEEGHFSGYFSNVELTDIDDKNVATVITEADLTKLSDQMLVSMGEMTRVFQVFGVAMFLLLMFLLSKQIIEKNAQSISMTKILGFRNLEIGSLYIVATSIVVVIALLLSVPLTDLMLRYIFEEMLYTMMTGYIPYIVSKDCYTQMILMGIASYVVVAIIQMVKIAKINKADALKNVE